jgi:hypothetical protein
MSLIGFLAALVVICLVWWALTSLMRAFKLEDPIATVVQVIFVVAVIVWLLSEVVGVIAPIRIH